MAVQLQLLLLHRDGGLNVYGTLLCINSAKQNIHILEGFALGFRDEEKHKEEIGNTEDAKHEEGAPAKFTDGMRCEFGDDEVEEPLSGRCEFWC